jgi:hypothetical protein
MQHAESAYSGVRVRRYGDTPTRMAFYECAATGAALPVVFDARLPAFLPFADLVDYSSFVTVLDPNAVLAGSLDAVNALAGAPEEDMLKQVQALHAVRHLMQYALRPEHLLIRFDELEVLHALDDAFTASVKAVLRNLCGRGRLPAQRCAPGS